MPERQKRVTLKDVANYCGLSRSLVAFILSNSGYRNSTLENRRKVAEAVKVLNYRPNTAARELRSRKSSIIGVAMPEKTAVLNPSGKLIGHLFPDGYVYDAKGVSMGKMYSDGMSFYNHVPGNPAASDCRF